MVQNNSIFYVLILSILVILLLLKILPGEFMHIGWLKIG